MYYLHSDRLELFAAALSEPVVPPVAPIPPGVGDVTHLRLTVPGDARAPIAIETEVRYRKFDAGYLRFTTGDDGRANDLPVMVLARDEVALPVRAADGTVYGDATGEPSPIPEWERHYDYGTGLFREGDREAGCCVLNDPFKPYFAPLRSPDGHVVTVVSPGDHRHQVPRPTQGRDL